MDCLELNLRPVALKRLLFIVRVANSLFASNNFVLFVVTPIRYFAACRGAYWFVLLGPVCAPVLISSLFPRFDLSLLLRILRRPILSEALRSRLIWWLQLFCL